MDEQQWADKFSALNLCHVFWIYSLKSGYLWRLKTKIRVYSQLNTIAEIYEEQSELLHPKIILRYQKIF